MNFKEIFLEKLQQANIQLTDIQVSQFVRYYELLVETNKVMNLTALTEPEDVAVKHFIDCLLAYDKDMQNATVADVGTGAGFPGMVWKIYDPTLKVTLIDSLNKRLKFLQTVIDELQLKDIVTLHSRAEDAGRDKKLREHFDFVTARAVARMSVLAEFCLPLVKVGGTFLALKADVAEEVAEAAKAVTLLGGAECVMKDIKLPGLADKRTLVSVKKIKPTSGKYPRKAGVAAKEPL